MAGLEARYEVKKINDPEGKHDECRYFVLDPQHDPIARQALRTYATAAGVSGYFELRSDINNWVDRIEGKGASNGNNTDGSEPSDRRGVH